MNEGTPGVRGAEARSAASPLFKTFQQGERRPLPALTRAGIQSHHSFLIAFTSSNGGRNSAPSAKRQSTITPLPFFLESLPT